MGVLASASLLAFMVLHAHAFRIEYVKDQDKTSSQQQPNFITYKPQFRAGSTAFAAIADDKTTLDNNAAHSAQVAAFPQQYRLFDYAPTSPQTVKFGPQDGIAAPKYEPDTKADGYYQSETYSAYDDDDFEDEEQFLKDTRGLPYKTSTSVNLEGPHQIETIETKSYHKEVPKFDVGSFSHSHSHHGSNKHAEVHYHQHKHMHKHDHKQDHVHKHKGDHKHSHSESGKHSHDHHSSHKHGHSGSHNHGHQHNGEHQHQHKEDHKHGHEHKSEHKHGHQEEHKHGHQHKHMGEHKHEEHHGHKHHGEHKHGHNHGHKHDHQSEHKHDSHHSHKHDGHHDHKHDGHHSHGHDHHHGHKHGHQHGHKHSHSSHGGGKHY